MLKIDKSQNKLVPLQGAARGLVSERYRLGELIVNSADAFFGEVGQKLFIVGKKVLPSDAAPVPIDLLALDPQGNAVIVALQQGKEHSPFARAITCSGLVAGWKPERFLQNLSERQVVELKAFLEVGLAEVNRDQRAILVAEKFDFEVLVATNWLRERYEMSNMCVRVSMSIDPDADAEYLHATNLTQSGPPEFVGSPAPAAETPAIPPQRRTQRRISQSHGKHLRIEYGGKVLQARLVDAGDGGLGAEVNEAMEAGSPVHFAGELHTSHCALGIHGRARVAYCRSKQNGVYRVGLAFEDVKVQKLDAPSPPSPVESSNPDPAPIPPPWMNGR